MKMKFVAAFMCLLLAGSRAEITLMLSNYTALRHTDAKIPCKYEITGEKSNATLKWSVVAANGSSATLCKYDITNKQSVPYGPAIERGITVVEEDGSLLIPNVTFDDEKTYRTLACEIDMNPIGAKRAQLKFKVVTLADSAPTTMLQRKDFPVSAGDTRTNVGFCESGFAKPTPEVRFYKGDVSLEDNSEDAALTAFTEDSQSEAKGDMLNMKRSLMLELTADDDNASFYCVVTSGFGETAETRRVQNVTFEKFRIRHPTDIVMVRTANVVQMDAFVGENVSFTCTANGFPAPTITFGGTETIGTSATFSKVIEKADKDIAIECSAQNGLNTAAVIEEYAVNPLYADDPVIAGERIVMYDQPIALECSGMANPEHRATKWKKGDKTMSETGTLRIEKAKFSDAGVYTCMLENEHGQLNREKQSMNVEVQGLVFDNAEDVDVIGKAKETSDLTCTVMSYPEPTFTWKKILADGEEEVPAKEPTKEGDYTYTSVLTVGPLETSNSEEEYKCFVSNKGKEISKSYIMPEIIPQAAAPTAAIIIIILVVILLVAIVLAVLHNKGMICKGNKEGEEEAEDIAVTKIPKDEKIQPPPPPPPANVDLEAGNYEEHEVPAEEDKLMNGSENQ